MSDDTPRGWTRRLSITEQQLRLALENLPREDWVHHIARQECTYETRVAGDVGREFTPIFWWFGEDGVPVLTLWDMNDESPEVALNKRYYIHARL